MSCSLAVTVVWARRPDGTEMFSVDWWNTQPTAVSASEVTTIWRFTNMLTITIIIIAIYCSGTKMDDEGL